MIDCVAAVLARPRAPGGCALTPCFAARTPCRDARTDRPLRPRRRPVQSADPQPLRRHDLRLAGALRLSVCRLGADHRRRRLRRRTQRRPAGQRTTPGDEPGAHPRHRHCLSARAVRHRLDRRAARRRPAGSSLVYTLSLAVYCSSWTFNGGVGRAAATASTSCRSISARRSPSASGRSSSAHAAGQQGQPDHLDRRPHRRALRRAPAARSARHGHRRDRAHPLHRAAAQIDRERLCGVDGDLGRSIGQPVDVRRRRALGHGDPRGLCHAVRQPVNPSGRAPSGHGGRDRPKSILKLLSLTIIGLFVVYGLFHGFGDLFGKAAAMPDLARSSQPPPDRYGFAWIAMTLPRDARELLPAAAVPGDGGRERRRAAPRPRHLAVSALSAGHQHLRPADRASPGGCCCRATPIPTTSCWRCRCSATSPSLALIAFLGGVSAAASMVVVETRRCRSWSATTSSCRRCCASMPLGLARRADLTRLLLWVRRGAMVAVMALGYLYMRHDSAEVDAGLDRADVVRRRRAVRAGAASAGCSGAAPRRPARSPASRRALLVWCYTLLIPSFAQLPRDRRVRRRSARSASTLLRPYALFGLAGLDPVTHATFWSHARQYRRPASASRCWRASGRWIAPMRRCSSMPTVRLRRRASGGAPASSPISIRWPRASSGASGRRRAFASWARERGLDPATAVKADAETVLFYERLLGERHRRRVGARAGRRDRRGRAAGGRRGHAHPRRDLAASSRPTGSSRKSRERWRHATSELRQANARLKELDRLKDDFVATVNHELRTPLASIRAFSEILRDHPDLDDMSSD